MSGPAWETVGRDDFRRDRWKRPLIRQADGSDAAYTRCTTFVGAPEDLFNVQRWEKRQVALGLAARSDLLLSVSAHRDDKEELNRICDQAKEAAGASAASIRGTAVHKLTELVDRGEELPRGLDPDTLKMLDAYAEIMKPFKTRAIEARLVQDRVKVAGSTDRVLGYQRGIYIGDVKTGSTVELGTGKIAGQLSMYAHSRPYDVNKDERLDHHGASTRWGLIIHLPAERPGEASLHWVDLEQGWAWCQVAGQVRSMRALRFGQWTKPFEAGQRPEPKVSEVKAAHKAAEAAHDLQQAREKVRRQILASDSRDLVLTVWKREQAIWDDDLTQVAKARVAELEAAS